MSATTNFFRLVSISHASSFDDPTGGSITETVTYLENRPGTRVSPALALDSYGAEGDVRFQGMSTPVTRGTKSDLTYTLKQIGIAGSTGTVTLKNTRAGAASFDFNSKPYNQSQKFHHDAEDTEDLAPITVGS